MKNTILCICTAAIVLALISSFTLLKNKNASIACKTQNELVEITPLIESTIMLYDTSKIIKGTKHANVQKDFVDGARNKFLVYPAISALKQQLENTYNNSASFIYFDPETAAPANIIERKAQAAKGFFKNVNILTFFEAWYYNKQTGEIAKRQLGYSVGQWDYEKAAFREWYLYFTSAEARNVYLKNW